MLCNFRCCDRPGFYSNLLRTTERITSEIACFGSYLFPNAIYFPWRDLHDNDPRATFLFLQVGLFLFESGVAAKTRLIGFKHDESILQF